MVAVLFYYTARDESALLDTSKEPDVVVNVVGKQWSWDFNYVDERHLRGRHPGAAHRGAGRGGDLPTLYLPVDKRVEFVLTARDVIHSFWVPAFLQKLDMIPGKVNRFQVVPTQEGTFQGKCAELCGAYHSQMLFNVKVVAQAEYDAHIAELKAKGQTGQLDNALNRGADHGRGRGQTRHRRREQLSMSAATRRRRPTLRTDRVGHPPAGGSWRRPSSSG